MSDPVADAAAAARRGELIVMPTDTVYGLGTRPDDPRATSRVFEAKQRDRDLALPILVASVAEASRLARFDDRARRLAGALWPGALTLVLPRTGESAPWDLGGEATTVAVRMPHHPIALAILAAAGPLAVTSANRSGEPTSSDCEELHALFGDAVSVYLCQSGALEGPASTVLDLTGDEPRLLRRGSIDDDAIAAALAG